MLSLSLSPVGVARGGLAVVVLATLAACGPSMSQGSVAGASLVRTREAERRSPPPEATARKPAPVMSLASADWLDRSEREKSDEPDRVVQALGLKPGDVVADVGAGTGYFSLRLARQVGPTGRVIATDVQQGMLDRLRANASRANLNNITPTLTTESDAGLPPGGVDLVLMVDVFHELKAPALTLTQVRRALRSDGRLAVVEYRGEDPALAVGSDHKMTLDQIKREVIPVGFRVDVVHEFLRDQRIVVFKAAL